MARSLEDDTLANLEEVVRLLQETHGSPRHGNKDDPLDELVYIILSNRTRQEAAQDGFEVLLQTFGSWSSAEAEAYLVSLPGVSKKVAKCVLMYSLGRSVLPVHVHVHRVAARLGLPAKRRRDTSQDATEGAVPKELRYSFHVNALAHGREYCRASRLRCGVCCVRERCATYRGEKRSSDEEMSTAIDLFAGAGGFSLGVEQAVFDVAAAVEFDPIHAATHHINFPLCKTMCERVEEVEGSRMLEAANIAGGAPDLVIGGPPCQGSRAPLPARSGEGGTCGSLGADEWGG